MKYIFLVVFIVINAATDSFAQRPALMGFSGPYPTNPVKDDLEKGNRMFSIDGLVSGGAGSAITNFQWSVSPLVGLMVARHLAVGLRLPYGKEVVRVKDNSTVRVASPDHMINSLSPEIYARYYGTPYRVKPFFQLATGYNFQFGEEKGFNGRSDRELKSRNYTMSGALGISFFVNRRFSMELQYNRRFLKKSSLDDANDKVKIRLGASWFIR